MRSILAITAGVLLCASVANAVDIPSSASGDWTGSGWNCRVLASATAAAPATHRTLEFSCIDPAHRQRVGAPVSLGCPGNSAFALYAQPGVSTGTPVVRIAGYSATTLALSIDGAPVVLTKREQIASPGPYTGCGAAPLPEPPKPWNG